MTLISALIVTFNPGEEIVECLSSLQEAAQHLSLEIILVDNASTNTISERLQAQFPQTIFIGSASNQGFGAGNNLAFDYSQGQYVMCVNPDQIIEVSALRTMLNFMEDNPDVGVVGPKIMDSDNKLVKSARAEYTLARLWAKYWMLDNLLPRLVYGDFIKRMRTKTQAFEVDWLQGSCLLIRREAFEQVQGFDEAFFLYMEDADLCDRLKQCGWRIMYLPTATARHYGGTTTSRFHVLRVRSYHFSPLYYHRKRGHHFATTILKFVFTIELFVKVILRLVSNLVRENETRHQQIQAEWQVLREVWRY